MIRPCRCNPGSALFLHSADLNALKMNRKALLWAGSFPPPTVIRGRSADNRKAPLNFSFPLEGKCHVVAKGCTRVSIPMKLTIVLLGPTSADLETLCRVSTKRRISVRTVSSGNATKYQSAGRNTPGTRPLHEFLWLHICHAPRFFTAFRMTGVKGPSNDRCGLDFFPPPL